MESVIPPENNVLGRTILGHKDDNPVLPCDGVCLCMACRKAMVIAGQRALCRGQTSCVSSGQGFAVLPRVESECPFHGLEGSLGFGPRGLSLTRSLVTPEEFTTDMRGFGLY